MRILAFQKIALRFPFSDNRHRITDHVALRSWPDTGFAIYRRGVRKAFPLSEKRAATMLLADGEHDMETDDMVMLLVMEGLIEPCEKGERPSAWSEFRAYDNACFPMMNFMVTGKCNFNCLREIYKRDMDVFAINTNGWYLTQEVIDEMKVIGCTPMMKISFDGIGFHDWIRQRKGAQESAIAICLTSAS